MKKLIFSFIPLLFITTLSATNPTYQIGAKSAAMGRTSLLRQGAFAAFNNQADLANLEKLEVGIFFENRFLLKELSLLGASVALPTKTMGTFGLGFQYFGNEAYNESRIALAYGRKLFENLTVGVELDWLSLSIPDYGNSSTLTFGLGFQYLINEQFTMAAHIFNPITNPITDFAVDSWPTTLKVGLGYFPNDKITLLVEAEKSVQMPLVVKAGIEYKLIKQLYLRGGIGSTPTYASFGAGVNVGHLKIDIATSFHPVLGYSPNMSARYTL